MAGIYIHIPFCRQACHYCDFHFSTNLNSKSQLVGAMVKELAIQKDFLSGETIDTLYFGGGTPSLLTGDELDLLINQIQQIHQLSKIAEITLEVNPDDVTASSLETWNSCGVNRLSIGIQSLHNDILRYLNRVHDSQLATQSLTLARQAGFKNISVDLIYGIPGLSTAAWEESIRQIIAYEPEHISSYSLTIEDNTVFGRWAKRGKLSAVEDDIVASQLDLLITTLSDAGYDQYEISNFSKPGFESKHNSSYWQNKSYLGIGPSAHSYDGAKRQFNVRNNYEYIRRIDEYKIPAEVELLSREDHINEYLLTRLRTRWGCNLLEIKNRFGYDLMMENNAYIQELIDKKMATVNGSILTLTRSGKLLADKIASDLFVLPT